MDFIEKRDLSIQALFNSNSISSEVKLAPNFHSKEVEIENKFKVFADLSVKIT